MRDLAALHNLIAPIMIKNYLALMKKPFSPPVKLEGMSLEAFQQLIKDGHLLVREARLIPTTKVGDELSLASIFLSTLKLVKEFREKSPHVN